MNGTRPRGDPAPVGGAPGAHTGDEPLDDWLGDISDDDWAEKPGGRPESRRDVPASDEPSAFEEGPRTSTAGRRDPRVAAAATRRARVERRRLVAVLALGAVFVLAVVSAALVLRGEGQDAAESSSVATSPAPAPTVTTPSSTVTTPSPTPSPTPPPATPPPPAPAAFTLPEGTKLQSAEKDPSVASDLEPTTDPEVVTELQQALTAAGYDPGPADGVYGPRTEAAVVAFQQASGLEADGVVGPATASKLNEVLASG